CVNYVVSPDVSLRGRSGNLTAHVLASPVAFAHSLQGILLGREAKWGAWREAGRHAQHALSTIPTDDQLPDTRPGTAHMSVLMRELIARLPSSVINTVGAGNHTAWAQWYMPTNLFPSALSTRNGSMGYSIPAAVAASKEAPERIVVAICGDGEFLMNGQELATAVQYGAAILAVVMDNGQFATIRDHQEAHYPGRVSGTQLCNPNFAVFAQAFGAHGEHITDNTQIPQAVERALQAVASGQPTVIHLVVGQQISVRDRATPHLRAPSHKAPGVIMRTYAVTNPATGQIEKQYPQDSDAQIKHALEMAASAGPVLTGIDLTQRSALLHRVADLYVERRDELAAIITREMGKPRFQAGIEIDIVVSIYRYYAEKGPKFLEDEELEVTSGGKALVRKEAVGVLLGIMPWNFP